MSADRYEINDADHGAIRISHPSAHLPHEFVCIHPGADPWSAFSNGVIRQQSRDIKLLTQMLHDQRLVIDDLEHRRVKVCDENDQLRADLAAAVAERDEFAKHCGAHKAEAEKWESLYDDCEDALVGEQLRDTFGEHESIADCARRVLQERDDWIASHAQLFRKLGNLLAVIHRDGGHYESEHGAEKACADAELAVHVQRGIADGYHDALKIWRQRAEQAEARLAAIEVAPMVARVVEIKRDFASGPYRCLDYDSDKLPGGFVELIARPAKDQE